MEMEGRRWSCVPNIFKFAREFVRVFSVTFSSSNNSLSIGQNPPPPSRKSLGTSLYTNTLSFLVTTAT